MIVATNKCGCPLPSLITKPVELQAFCSPCCPGLSRTHYPKAQATASTRKSQEIISRKRCSTDKNESNSIGIKVSNARAIGTDKIVSEIMKKGQPYKEIEAVINDNRVIIRMHKEPVKKEYDPPCECIDQQHAGQESTLSLTKCDDGVAFDMAQGSLELHRIPREATTSSMMEKTCEETGCRTVTLYPQADARDGDDSAAPRTGNGRPKEKRPLDLEENPNIFVLRIRRYSDNSDKKQKIDLEFRAPRPWQPREDKKLREDLEELEEHMSEDEEINGDMENDEIRSVW